MATEAEIRARLIVFSDATTEPVLSTEDLDVLMSMAKRVDKNGVLPTDTGWTPSWDLYYAVAQGWLIKSGRLAPRYLFMTGGKMLSRHQFYDHCMKMYATYARKSGLKAVRLGRAPDAIYAMNNWNQG